MQLRSRAPLLFSAILLTGCPHPTAEKPIASASAKPNIPRTIPEATTLELPDAVSPTAYRLSLEVDPTKDRFQGKVEIALSVNATTDLIVLHARDQVIHEARVTAGGRQLTATLASRVAVGGHQPTELVVLLSEPLTAHEPASLILEYEAPFALLQGLYRVSTPDGEFAFTQMEPIDARRMFPCFDEPRYKTPFTISVTTPPGAIAVSNAPEASRTTLADSRVRFDFAPTAPLPTYLVALGVGPLELTQGRGLRLVTTRGRGASGALGLEAADAARRALEGYFGIDYPFDKLDIAAVPNFGPGAMENAGLVTFREELILARPNSPAIARRRMRLVLAHELAHMWFGDLVTMHWWDDLWLNEGFATWMAPKACDRAFADFSGVPERVLDKAYAMTADTLPSARPVRSPVTDEDQIRDAGGWSAYQKGASVLAMLEAWVGEERFQKAIEHYVRDNAGRSITSSALFQALDSNTGKPVSSVAASFLDQPGVPLVDAKVSCTASKTEVELVASDLSERGRKWNIPVCLRALGETKCALVADSPVKIEFTARKPDSCPVVVPNAGENGYYRYRLDAAAESRLEASFATLSEAERAGLLLDVWALALSQKGDVASVVRLLRAADLAKERSRVVLDAVVTVLGEMERTMVDATSRAAFNAFVVELLAPVKKALGAPTPGEPDATKLARVAVLTALADQGADSSIAGGLEPSAVAYLDDPDKADPDLGPLALRLSARVGGAARALDGARLKLARTPDERVALTQALASLGDPAALKRALELVVDGTIRAGDFRHVRWTAARRPETRAPYMAFVRERFDALVKALDGAGALVAGLRDLCDQGELDEAVAFFKPKIASLEGVDRAFEEGVEEAKRCIAVKERSAGARASALKKAK
ncbi:MAG: M1 family aminopeptidase [Polyangiaceae bacterium]